MHSAVKGGLIGVSIAIALLLFEYVAIVNASKQRARRRALKASEFDQSERARLRNLGWFCVQLPLIGAGLGWLIW